MPEWRHSPLHLFPENGAYIVTAATYHKERLFHDADRLTLVRDCLITLAERYDWQLQAWAVFSNHYHFVAASPDNPGSLP